MIFDHSYYEGVPLPALKSLTRSLISTSLNGSKVIPSPEGFLRDWRGLAEIASVNISSGCPDPSAAVISAWEKQLPRPTFKDIIVAFKSIDRFDVLDDLSELLLKDAEHYYNIKGCSHNAVLNGNFEDDDFVLTIADLHRRERGEPPQNYDAFLLYDEADTYFADNMVQILEDKYGLKLCLKERDLLGGLLFEHEVIMKLIAERCGHVIVIVSPNFLTSPMNRFFTSFAIAEGIMFKKRKIVPCIYNMSAPPRQFGFYVNLYFNPDSLSNFWQKLYLSIYQPMPTTVKTVTTGEPSIQRPETIPQLPSPPTSNLSSNDTDETTSMPDYLSESCESSPSATEESKKLSFFPTILKKIKKKVSLTKKKGIPVVAS